VNGIDFIKYFDWVRILVFELQEFQECWSVSRSAELTLEQLKKIIEDEMFINQGVRQVQDDEDGEEDLDPDNTSSVLNSILKAMNNEFKHKCPDEVVRLPNAHMICQSTDDHIPSHNHSIPGLPGTQSLAQQVWAIVYILTRWVWDSDMPGPLVSDSMGVGRTFTSVAAAILFKLLMENNVMGILLSILRANMLAV
jgi:hypothetical protein